MTATFLALAVLQSAPREFRAWTVAFERAGDLYTVNAEAGEPKLLIREGESPRWAPDRQRVAFVRNHEIWIVGRDGRDPWRVYRAPNSDDRIESLEWGGAPGEASRSTLVFSVAGKEGGDMFRLDMSGPERKAERLVFGAWLYDFTDKTDPVVSPSGRSVAFVANGDLFMSYLDEGAWQTTRLAALARYDFPQNRGSNSTVGVRGLSWVPAARKIVYGFERSFGSGFHQVWLYDFTGVRNPLEGSERATRRMLMDGGRQPRVSPDGKWVMVHSVKDGDLFAISMDGRTRVRVVRDSIGGDWR